MDHDPAQSQIVGQFRRFGPIGPVYEIVGIGQTDLAGESWLQVRLVESGQNADYKLKDALRDPFEA